MEKRQLTLTLEQAKVLYASNESLRPVLLETFPELQYKGMVDKWEDLETISGYWVRADCADEINNAKTSDNNKNIFATEKQAKSALASAQLSQLMKALGSECEVDWSKGEDKYTIKRTETGITRQINITDYYFLAFKTYSVRDEFLKRHIDLINQYFEL